MQRRYLNRESRKASPPKPPKFLRQVSRVLIGKCGNVFYHLSYRFWQCFPSCYPSGAQEGNPWAGSLTAFTHGSQSMRCRGPRETARGGSSSRNLAGCGFHLRILLCRNSGPEHMPWRHLCCVLCTAGAWAGGQSVLLGHGGSHVVDLTAGTVRPWRELSWSGRFGEALHEGGSSRIPLLQPPLETLPQLT